jgi:hypothetical protein
VLASPAFRAAQVTTRWLETQFLPQWTVAPAGGR